MKLRPRRRPPAPVPPDPDEYDEEPEEDAEIVGDNGGGSRGGGGSVGPKPPSTRRKRLAIDDVRLVPVRGQANRYRVSFRANEAGVADIVLAEAGDSAIVVRKDVRAWSADGETLPLSGVDLGAAERVEFEITSGAPLGERAWVVSALLPETQ